MPESVDSSARQRYLRVRPIVLSVLAFAGLCWLSWTFLKKREREEPLAAAAVKLHQAFEQNDANTIFHYSHEYEKRGLHLTTENLKWYLNWCHTSLAEYKRFGEPVVETSRRGNMLEATYEYRRADNVNPVYVSWVVEATPLGPRSNVMFSTFYAALVARHGYRHASKAVGLRKWYAIQDFYRADASKLDFAGIRGLGSLDHQRVSVSSWKQLADFGQETVRAWEESETVRQKTSP